MGSVWVYHLRAGWQRLRSWWRWSQIRFRIRGIGSQQFFLRRSAACWLAGRAAKSILAGMWVPILVAMVTNKISDSGDWIAAVFFAAVGGLLAGRSRGEVYSCWYVGSDLGGDGHK